VSNPQTKTQHYWNQRFGPFNENVKRVAAEFGATVMDANSREVFGDPRMLAKDRLHLSTEGHRRVAAAVLSAIQMPHDADWQDPMSPYKPAPAPSSSSWFCGLGSCIFSALGDSKDYQKVIR
jgi:hypothetical protein